MLLFLFALICFINGKNSHIKLWLKLAVYDGSPGPSIFRYYHFKGFQFFLSIIYVILNITNNFKSCSSTSTNIAPQNTSPYIGKSAQIGGISWVPRAKYFSMLSLQGIPILFIYYICHLKHHK